MHDWYRRYGCVKLWFCKRFDLARGEQTCHLSQTLHGQNFRIIFFTKKGVHYNKLCFPTKKCKLCFHMIDIHTRGYITLNRYIIGIASIGLPKVNLWATE